jgi:hypothetical protein
MYYIHRHNLGLYRANVNIGLAKKLFAALGLPPDSLDGLLSDLEFMARYKYDHYETYVPGKRFLEHLCIWLDQFKAEDRSTALRFVRERLIFVSQREMQELARLLYYDHIVPQILESIIQEHELKPFQYTKAFKEYPAALRRCLFVGLSDGAKIDFFRRHNVELSQEQVLPYYRTAGKEYIARLQADTKDPKAVFNTVFLIDDFTGSGYTLLREEHGRIVGSLERVYEHHATIIDQAKRVYLCHYIATANAHEKVQALANSFPPYAGKLKTLSALTLPPSLSIIPTNPNLDDAMQDIIDMCDLYFNKDYNNANTLKGGGIKLGYGNQGLPLVLYSNTPNNSLFLIWYDAPNRPTNSFHALFRRIDRHKPD